VLNGSEIIAPLSDPSPRTPSAGLARSAATVTAERTRSHTSLERAVPPTAGTPRSIAEGRVYVGVGAGVTDAMRGAEERVRVELACECALCSVQCVPRRLYTTACCVC